MRIAGMLAGIALLCACSGGGGSATPSSGVVGATATPGSTASPGATATPTTNTVTNSSEAPITIDDSPTTALGNSATTGTLTTAKSNTPIDGIPCVATMGTKSHYHVHFSLYVNGVLQTIPAGIGIYEPAIVEPQYYVLASSTEAGACYYEIHTHDPMGVVHIESPTSGATHTAGQLFDIAGTPLSANGFSYFTGATRWFDTDETSGAAGSHPVHELTGTDPATVTMVDHHEYTIEVGTPLVNTDNLAWSTTLP